MNRIIVVGDPHGCLKELILLLDKVKWDKENDKLVILGDLVDRGPDSVELIKFCRLNKITCCLGNHEDKYLRYIKHNEKATKDNSYINPMNIQEHKKKIIDQLSSEDIEYLKSLPHSVKLMDAWYAVHAGVNPTKDIIEQDKKDLSYIRYVDEDGNPVKGVKPKGNIHWSQKWTGTINIVYGHFVHSLSTPKLTRGINGAKIWGIDTGCCFGGYLTALILPSEEIVQVKALEEYVKYIINEE